MDGDKEYDLLPCPWCESPVHVQCVGTKLIPVGFFVTCGNFKCDCPNAVVYKSEEEAVQEWNNGNSIMKIKKREEGV